MSGALKRTRGLFDFVVALLCLWAAYFHTPVGALVRQTGGWIFHVHSSAQPLLSYFRTGPEGGTYWAGRTLPPSPPSLKILGGAQGPSVGMAVPVDQALGLAVGATLESMHGGETRFAREQARAAGVDPAELLHAATAPRVLPRVLAPLKTRLGSDEAGVLALFVAESEVRFAVDRTRAQGSPLTLPAVARNLPEGQRVAAEHAGAAIALAAAYSLRWPLPESVRVTSPFGWREHPVLGEVRLHAGVDLSVPVGTEVRAAGAGVVRRASADAVNGKMLVLDHGHGVTTVYCHSSALLVGVGDAVRVGEVIARSGASGRVTGPHLHYQVVLSDVPVDPLRLRRAVVNGAASAPGVEAASATGKPLDARHVEARVTGLAPHTPVLFRAQPREGAWPSKCPALAAVRGRTDGAGAASARMTLSSAAGCNVACAAAGAPREFEVRVEPRPGRLVRSAAFRCFAPP